MHTRGSSDDEPFLLATLPPSQAHRRAAFAIIIAFVVGFVITTPFAYEPLPRFDAWIWIYSTALVITDTITAALLLSQFSVTRHRALLVLALGYLFSALTIVPYTLTFPGVYAPMGLLGAGLQTAVWLYLFWHWASPFSVLVYAFLRNWNGARNTPKFSVRTYIVSSVAAVVAAVCALTWLVTAHHGLLPELYLDQTRLAPAVRFFGGLVFLLCGIALAVLWVRQRSVLDLWLMVTVCAWLLEITLQGLFLTDRFSLAWYVGRIYSLYAGCVVLVVLLSETTTHYAHLARSAIRQRSARQARQVAMDTMAASIAHELKQPLGAIALNSAAALMHLARTPPDTEELRATLGDIAADSARGTQVIASLRAMFSKGVHGRARFDANGLIHEVLAMLDLDLRAQGISVSTELRVGLPELVADRGQLQQVFLNLIMNAIESMHSVTDRARSLRVTSDLVRGTSDIVLTVRDSGVGFNGEDKARIFEPFFTTKSAGTGIGLTICRSIVDSHGGTLRASANHPYGTVIEVVIPIASAEVG